MRKSVLPLVSGFFAVALSNLATAADIPAPVVKAPAAVVAAQDWSGVYVGFEGGYGWGKEDLDAVFPGACAIACGVSPTPTFFADVPFQSGKPKGWLLGGFAGVQKQWGAWVLGIEADFDAADIKSSAAASSAFAFFTAGGGTGGPPACGDDGATCVSQTVAGTTKIDALGSLRGKVGFAPAPNVLIYGTGGLAFAHVKHVFTVTNSIVETGVDVNPPIVSTSALSGGTSMLGWAAGAGIDWKWPLDAGSAWVFGVEYLHYDFGTQTITVSDNTGSSSAFQTKLSVDAVKGRIGYLFSTH